MNVNLTPELERLVQEKVASGLYNNQSEVVREGLRLLFQQDRVREAHIDYLKAALSESLRQADRGELIAGDDAENEMRALIRADRQSDTHDS